MLLREARLAVLPPRVSLVTPPSMTPEQRLAVAFSLARYGFHVFPVSRRKVPLVKAWESVATRDPETIATWWTLDFPGALVGYATGLSGVVVADLDTDKPYGEGHEKAGQSKGAGADNLAAAGLVLPETPLDYETPSGGRHVVYAAPKGRALTIAQDVPVAGVDIRAGNGFAIYYGRKLKAAPELPPAPDWLLVDAGERREKRAKSASVEQWAQRVEGGKPSKAVKKAAALIAEHGTDHGTMLKAVGELVRLGTTGEPGAAKALKAARSRYLEHYPDHARHFDAAAEGSVKTLGLPPVRIPLSKPERREIARRASGGVMQPKKDPAPGKPHEPVVADDLTDAALAEQIADELRDRYAYGAGLGLMRYDGRIWAPVDEPSLIEATRLIMRRIRAEETHAAIMRGDKKREAEARALEQRTRIVAVARLAGGIMAERQRATDAHPDLLNTPSGVVDLRTSELLPHDPALMFTKITAAPYEPDADRSLWLKALEALPPESAAWLQVRFGQSLTGYMPDDDVLVVLRGDGENGKTTVLHSVRCAAGDYAGTVPKRLLLASPGDHPTELTTLMGLRFAVIEELPEGRHLNVERLKDTVGTPTITARRMRENNVTWAATHSLMLSTNYTPIVNETDHGTWRRLALVDFPYRFVKPGKVKASRDRVRDRSIRPALEAPNAGALAWMVEGARQWYERGRVMPDPPKKVRRDTRAWRMDADPVLGYAAERLVTGAKAEGWAIAAVDLAPDFNQWLEARGHKPWSLQTINARFAGHEALRDVERKAVRFGSITPSRPAFTLRALPTVSKAWVGVRFADEPGPTVPPSREVASYGLGAADD